MTYSEYKSYPALGDHIHAFWQVEGTGAGSEQMPVLPDAHVDLIFNLAESCRTANNTFTMQHGLFGI